MATPIPIATLYDSRAVNYDSESKFHVELAEAYVDYVNPGVGESLLDLACGTGLVGFALAPRLQPSASIETLEVTIKEEGKGRIIGVDISRGMLGVAREKLDKLEEERRGWKIEFLEGDVCSLDTLPGLKGLEGSFDIITLSSSLVLLPDPLAALRGFVKYLKRGGRLVTDVPTPSAMIGVKVLNNTRKHFSLPVVGDREWISGPESLKSLIEEAGLSATITETEPWKDIPARTKYIGRTGEEGVWGVDEGGDVFDFLTKEKGMREEMGEEKLGEMRGVFERLWREKAVDGVVRERNGLFVGVGFKK